MFLTAGTRIDKYEILAPLAVGGMAELYVARARGIEDFEKLCVLKRILPQHATDDEFVKMFLDEARLAATLQHPNVVAVYDVGVHQGRHYFTMEFIHGKDLAAIVAAARGQKRGLKVEHALAVVAAAAAGLHHAHEQRGSGGAPLNIVHRDVSPTNILVSYDGNAKIVDFGIAKAAARRTQTTAGGAKGKLCYMSPEQVRAERDLDRRSDIFSLAIVLYELTTGKPLFRGDSDYRVAEQIIEGRVPPPTQVRPTYPPALERIVMKGLAVRREDRFATARGLQAALEDFARSEGMQLSAVGLSDFMMSLFGEEARAWELARRSGQSMAIHVSQLLATSTATSHTTVHDQPRRRRWSLVAAGAGAAAVLGGAIVLAQRRGAGDDVEPAPTSTPAPARDAAAPPLDEAQRATADAHVELDAPDAAIDAAPADAAPRIRPRPPTVKAPPPDAAVRVQPPPTVDARPRIELNPEGDPP